jgi:hypothetical protein
MESVKDIQLAISDIVSNEMRVEGSFTDEYSDVER